MRPQRFSPLGTYVAALNGLFVEVSTPIFRARLPSNRTLRRSSFGSRSRGLLDRSDRNKVVPVAGVLPPLFEYKVPAPPQALLAEVATFFRWVMEQESTGDQQPVLSKVPVKTDCEKTGKYQAVPCVIIPHKAACPQPAFSGCFENLKQREALVWLTYRPEDHWQVTWPGQETYGGAVWAPPIRPTDQVGMVIHSHGNLRAFFSTTDNEDEQFGFLYGVIGNLNHGALSMRFRVGFAGEYMEVRNVFQ